MRPARLRWLTSAAVALTLIAAGSGAQAQRNPTGDAFCALLTAEEVGTALGTPVAAEPQFALGPGHGDDEGLCGWFPTTTDEFMAVWAGWAGGSLADLKAAWPGGSDLVVAGRAAYFYPDPGIPWLLVESDAGLLDLTAMVGIEGDVVAALATLAELGELAVSRSVSLPARPQPEPEPTPEGDLALETLFPVTVAGEAVVVTSEVGKRAIPFHEDRAAVAEALGTLGKTFRDLSRANWGVAGVAGIVAFRVAGGDASVLVPSIIVATQDARAPHLRGDVDITPTQVAGKDVTVVTSRYGQRYVYAAGEVVWVVRAEEPTLTEILTALPPPLSTDPGVAMESPRPETG